MFGPGNPNAAMGSMFGTPKGFPPIWKSIHKHKDWWRRSFRGTRTPTKSFSNVSQTALKSYRCIRERRRKKSPSRQISRYSVCWRQQRQSFSLIWNWSYRRVKTGIRREPHTSESHIIREIVFSLHLSKLPYRSEQISLSSTQSMQWQLLLAFITLLQWTLPRKDHLRVFFKSWTKR